MRLLEGRANPQEPGGGPLLILILHDSGVMKRATGEDEAEQEEEQDCQASTAFTTSPMTSVRRKSRGNGAECKK